MAVGKWCPLSSFPFGKFTKNDKDIPQNRVHMAKPASTGSFYKYTMFIWPQIHLSLDFFT